MLPLCSRCSPRYDISKRVTFENLERWLQAVLRGGRPFTTHPAQGAFAAFPRSHVSGMNSGPEYFRSFGLGLKPVERCQELELTW